MLVLGKLSYRIRLAIDWSSSKIMTSKVVLCCLTPRCQWTIHNRKIQHRYFSSFCIPSDSWIFRDLFVFSGVNWVPEKWTSGNCWNWSFYRPHTLPVVQWTISEYWRLKISICRYWTIFNFFLWLQSQWLFFTLFNKFNHKLVYMANSAHFPYCLTHVWGPQWWRNLACALLCFYCVCTSVP